ncbi:MAG: extracellular solute-binding protein [Acidimicrobiia bacterium]|nr:extracellular solute-binding protein [Acidimicrobiia bacterium]
MTGMIQGQGGTPCASRGEGFSGRVRHTSRLMWLLVVVALIASACGGSDNSANSDDGAKAASADQKPDNLAAECPLADGPSAGTTIDVWHAMVAQPKTAFEELVDRYNESQDAVTVKISGYNSFAELQAKVRDSLGSDSMPDVILMEDTTTQWAIDTRSFMPVQACLDAGGKVAVDQQFIDHYTVEGTTWAIPVSVATAFLFYNRTMFTDAGLDPDKPPTSLEEIRTASQTIVDAGVAPHGIAMNLASWIFEHMVLLDGQKIVDHDNGRSGRAAKATLVAKPAEQLFQWTKDMTTDSLMMPFEWKPTSIDHFLAMANGQAAMGIESSSALATVMLLIGGGTVQDTGGLDPDALGAGGIDPEGMDIGVAPLPVIATGDGGYQAGGAAAFVASNSSPAERVASWDFISFMSQPAEQAKWHIASSFTPMSSDSAQLPELTSYWETTPDQKLSWDMYQTNGEGEASGPVIGPYDEVREAIAAAWFRAATGDPKAELQTAETEVNELLADYADRVG